MCIVISDLIFWFSELEVFNITFYLTQVESLNKDENSAVESLFAEIEYFTNPDLLEKEIKKLKSRDLIIIDYSSKRFDPIIFTQKVKTFSKDTAVILIMENRNRAVEAYDVGADDYILKPLNLERLHKAVKNIKHRREQV